MKKYCLVSPPQYSQVLYVFVFLCISHIYANGQQANDNITKIYYNKDFFFSIELPKAWITSERVIADSELKLSSESSDGHEAIEIYAIEGEGDIDLEKMAAADTKIFDNLGKLIDTKKIQENTIEKSYRTEDYITKILFQTHGKLGYVLLWKSLDKSDDTYSKISSSFKVSIPFLKTFTNWFKGTIGTIIVVIGFLGSLIGLGLLGRFIRKGVELKKALRKLLVESSQQGLIVNDKWHTLNRKSYFYIIIPILILSIIYILILIEFSQAIFLYSLLGFIPLILGYFGVFLVPDVD